MIAAEYVIHLDPWWNPAVEDQVSVCPQEHTEFKNNYCLQIRQLVCET